MGTVVVLVKVLRRLTGFGHVLGDFRLGGTKEARFFYGLGAVKKQK